MAFYSKRDSPAEANYEIHNKELMTIILDFEEWMEEHSLAEHHVPVLSDHQNLEYFMFNKTFSRGHAQWV